MRSTVLPGAPNQIYIFFLSIQLHGRLHQLWINSVSVIQKDPRIHCSPRYVHGFIVGSRTYLCSFCPISCNRWFGNVASLTRRKHVCSSYYA